MADPFVPWPRTANDAASVGAVPTRGTVAPPGARLASVAVTVARAVNDSVRFCLELAALAGLAIWGWETGPDGVNVVLAIAAPLAAAVLWGLFDAPKARRHPPDPWRLLLEILVFGGGAVAFAAAGLETSAVVLGVATVAHLTATFVLDQRGPRAV